MIMASSPGCARLSVKVLVQCGMPQFRATASVLAAPPPASVITSTPSMFSSASRCLVPNAPCPARPIFMVCPSVGAQPREPVLGLLPRLDLRFHRFPELTNHHLRRRHDHALAYHRGRAANLAVGHPGERGPVGAVFSKVEGRLAAHNARPATAVDGELVVGRRLLVEHTDLG